MAATQADLDALDSAISSGTVEVQFQDRRERYQSMKDMLTARTLLYNQLHPPSSSPAIVRQVRMVGSKGL